MGPGEDSSGCLGGIRLGAERGADRESADSLREFGYGTFGLGKRFVAEFPRVPRLSGRHV